MKRIILLLIIVLALPGFVKAQDDPYLFRKHVVTSAAACGISIGVSRNPAKAAEIGAPIVFVANFIAGRIHHHHPHIATILQALSTASCVAVGFSLKPPPVNELNFNSNSKTTQTPSGFSPIAPGGETGGGNNSGNTANSGGSGSGSGTGILPGSGAGSGSGGGAGGSVAVPGTGGTGSSGGSSGSGNPGSNEGSGSGGSGNTSGSGGSGNVGSGGGSGSSSGGSGGTNGNGNGCIQDCGLSGNGGINNGNDTNKPPFPGVGRP